MSTYTATVEWARQDNEAFTDNQYSRGHQWRFDGGEVVNASSAPDVVPLPFSVEENVDPEEALLASLSSCHMLFFLAFAAKKQLVIDRYIDTPTGVVGKRDDGKNAFTKIQLQPKITFNGEQPSQELLDELHERSHKYCFIANSLHPDISIEIAGKD